MKTNIIKLSEKETSKDDKNLEKITNTLKIGGLVVFPTETVYGLGANGLDKNACEGIFKAKGRPNDNPLILHIAYISQLDELVKEVPKIAQKCIKKFWPGPLTIIFKKSDLVPKEVTGGLETVAIRMPSNKIAHKILADVILPIAAPSANISGRPSPTKTEHVIEDLMGKVDIIVDGGHTVVGIESTVLDVTSDPPMILRPGKITLEDLQKVDKNISIDHTTIDAKDKTVPKSPGQKYKHYAPKGKATCFVGDLNNVVAEINKRLESCKGKSAVLATSETKDNYIGADLVLDLGSRENLEEVANSLFDLLRVCDEKKVEYIFAEGFELKGIGLSIMNRLLKACAGRIVIGL
ncbi:L-threonylcarbamoyladenylate synthase [uncultured Peptoniphilus sp.]|uniref:L-threonylcarbamoyladenylate synthase n=1 Tax=uncultured Peptoniphilus sp. TaxID=254354 RepID=UPI002805278D|nr:L-threonylcarbamoyladenylate synthase [uncultured Peptoniphilus sp.]